MALHGNIGEWSEIYTLLKVLSDRKLFAGDGNLNKIKDLIFPVIKIIRNEAGKNYEYSYDENLVIIIGDNQKFEISIEFFAKYAAILLERLKSSGNGSAFEIPEIEDFLNAFNCRSLKASSSVKTDIRIVIHDLRTSTTPELGFSIKSQLGSASTLLNAGKTTNFIFKIINPKISPLEIEKINSINTPSKIKDRLQEIYKRSDGLRFVKTENSNFGNNLQMIDSSLPLILAEIVHLFYSSSYSNLDELIGNISKVNPIGYDTSGGHPFYKYKIKRFLSDTALGMMPSRVWTGLRDATGGYLVVKEDGEILCYHVYNQNNFEDYLYNNTRLDTASSKRFGFGKIYQEDGGLFFKLNLQIRFIK